MKYIYRKNELIKEAWYHGTPDNRSVEKDGFIQKYKTISYIENIELFNNLQKKASKIRNSNEDEYFKILNQLGNLKQELKYPAPLFLSNVYSVAKSYADSKRAFDYQNSVEHTYKVKVTCNKVATIFAVGKRFRFIPISNVVNGFISSGTDQKETEKLIAQFNYYTKNGIKTDVIAAIGYKLGFDCIDVKGVLDSYHGGTIKSDIRMVLDVSKVEIIT
jgi:hypothetical protein